MKRKQFRMQKATSTTSEMIQICTSITSRKATRASSIEIDYSIAHT
jgi:hypothetical protein